MKISDFNDALLYSNKNLEKIATRLVNESSNAVLMEMYSDKCLLADHETGKIYEANYDFDGKTFVFENFNVVDLENDDTSLRESISDYFDDVNVNLVESYENKANETDAIDNSLAECLASKCTDNIIDYSELVGVNEEFEDLKNSDAFKVFAERIETHPLDSIKFFDWENPVKVSLIDEDTKTIVSKTAVQKARKLRTNVEFKKELVEAINSMNNGDNSLISELFSNNICLLSLTESELKELVGLSIIGDKELVENRKNICKNINTIIEEDEFLSEKKASFASISEEGNEDDGLPEISEEDSEKFIDALKIVETKTANEELIEKIEDIIGNIAEAAENGETNISAIKEAVSILSL